MYRSIDLRQTLPSLGLGFSINKMRWLDKKISKVPVSPSDKTFSMTTFSKQQFFFFLKNDIKEVQSFFFSHAINYILAGSWLMTGVLHGSEWIINPILQMRKQAQKGAIICS